MSARDRHRWILASAGSGKTFQLAHQLIGLLAAGHAPDRILATTFTRKAAAEIFQRVVSRLAEAAADDGELASLNGALGGLGLPEVSRERCGALLLTLLRSLHRARVMTIDAWLSQMAGALALELDLAPGWTIADDDTDRTIRLEAIDRMLESGEIDTLVLLMRALHRGLGLAVHEAILKAVDAAHKAYLATEDRPEVWGWPVDTSWLLDRATLERAIGDLERAPVATTRSGEPNRNWTKAIDSAVEALRAGDWAGFTGGGPQAKLIAGTMSYYGVELPDGLIAALESLVCHASAAQLAELDAWTRTTRRLIADFDHHYAELKRRRGAQRFDDVPRLLLAADVSDLAGLFFRLDARLDHVLLDEFQDTSVTQLALLEPMLDEILAHRDSDRSLFIVGDPKQSLYGWRDAEPELLVRLPERFPALGDFEPLDHSWRSSPVVLGAVNAVFGDLEANDALAGHSAAGAWATLFREHRAAAPNRDLPGRAVLRVAPEPEDPDEPRPAAIVEAVAAALELAGSAPWATVAVLVRTNKHIPYLIARLRRLGRERGLEASEEGGSSLIDAPPVAAALALLRLADHPGDTAARYLVATSPLGPALGLGDWRDDAVAHAVSGTVRDRLVGEGYARVLDGLLRVTAGAMDERGGRRFEQLVAVAGELDESPPARPSDAARWIESRRLEAPTSARIRVMTIHASKGLEFDAVVLPDLAGTWSLRSREPLVDRAGPLDPPRRVVQYPGQDLRALDPDLEAIYQQGLQREIHQELCALYVAMTRAARGLEMIVNPEKPASGDRPAPTAGRVLRAALAPDRPAEPGEELWASGTGSWREGGPPAEPARAPAERSPAPRVVAASGPGLARARRVAPSSLEGGGRVRAEMAIRPSSEGAAIGSLYHHWFERVEWLGEGEAPVGELVASARRAGLDAALAEAHAAGWIRACRSPEIAALLDAGEAARRLGSASIVVRREWPFAVPDAAGAEPVVLTGRIDRAAIAPSLEAPRRAEIIDFKTDALEPDDGASLAARVEHYRPQIEAYRRAMAALTGLEPGSIAAVLAFTSVGRAVTVGGA